MFGFRVNAILIVPKHGHAGKNGVKTRRNVANTDKSVTATDIFTALARPIPNTTYK